jgi:predicted metal-dependent hydrolase
MPCEQKPCDELRQAIAEFNRGDWFQCHETLEELWVGAKGELRDFYQGVLQIAVALHHWRNGNFKGALILLKSGGECLDRVPPVCLGVDVASLRTAAGVLREALCALGEERMAELAAPLIPVIGEGCPQD